MELCEHNAYVKDGLKNEIAFEKRLSNQLKLANRETKSKKSTHDQQVIEKLDTLKSLLDFHSNELAKINLKINQLQTGDLKLSKNELKAIKENSIDKSITKPSLESTSGLNLSNIMQLKDYNYIEWSRSVVSELDRFDLSKFLFNQPILSNPSEIAKDKKVKESILSTISASSRSRISVYNISYSLTKELWSACKHLFYDCFLDRQESNLKYITRKNVRAICEVKAHVNQFKESIIELIAIDMKFDSNILIDLFLNSFSEHLPIFQKMIKQNVDRHNLNFTESLNFASTQASYYLAFKDSNEPTNLEEPNNKKQKKDETI